MNTPATTTNAAPKVPLPNARLLRIEQWEIAGSPYVNLIFEVDGKETFQAISHGALWEMFMNADKRAKALYSEHS